MDAPKNRSRVLPVVLTLVGCLGLALAIWASGELVQSYLRGVAIHGCGEGAGCDKALDSIYGKLPLLGTPVAFLGFAFFVSALVGVLAGAVWRQRPWWPFVWFCRLGALASIAYTAINAFEGYHCVWCYRSHAGNLVFWISLEAIMAVHRGRSGGTNPGEGRKSAKPAAIVAAAVFGLLAIGLVSAGVFAERDAKQKEETALAGSNAEMIRRAREAAAAAANDTEAAVSHTDTERTDSETASGTDAQPDRTAPPPKPAEKAEWYPDGFTGRYHWGNEVAPIRIVMFTGYQCPDCKLVERQLERIMDTRNDVSISIKHFPFNGECNPTLKPDFNHHPNACWAARAAEAAGLMGGDEAFFSMHRQLFERGGVFETQDQLAEMAMNAGIEDIDQYFTLLSDAQIVEWIKADAQEGRDLGLMFTPMIFVNGVELKGWAAPRAIERTVEALAAENLPAMDARNDRPPSARDRAIADWTDSPRVEPTGMDDEMWRGPADAPVTIVVWGSYIDPVTAELVRRIDEMRENRGDVRYAFRHFPGDASCNDALPRTVAEGGCDLHTAAEAARQVGGDEAFWEVTDWLLDQATRRNTVDDQRVQGIAMAAGLDAARFNEARSGDAVDEAIREDIASWERISATLRRDNPLYRQGLPALWVNGRMVLRWKLGEEVVLDGIIAEAVREVRSDDGINKPAGG